MTTTGFPFIYDDGGGEEEILSKSFSETVNNNHSRWISSKTRLMFGLIKLKRKIKFAVYSRSLCQSAICRRGELQTSFQWFKAEPLLRGPPNSNRPMTSFFVTRSQSKSISSRETPSSVWPVPSVVGMSNAKLSLKTGLKVRFLTWVFFFAIRCP